MNVLVLSEGKSCGTARINPGTDLALAEWGGGPIMSRSALRQVNDVQRLRALNDRCPRLVTFQNVSPIPLYVLGTDPGPGMGDTFCRACVLGTVPRSENGIPIITDGYAY